MINLKIIGKLSWFVTQLCGYLFTSCFFSLFLFFFFFGVFTAYRISQPVIQENPNNNLITLHSSSIQNMLSRLPVFKHNLVADNDPNWTIRELHSTVQRDYTVYQDNINQVQETITILSAQVPTGKRAEFWNIIESMSEISDFTKQPHLGQLDLEFIEELDKSIVSIYNYLSCNDPTTTTLARNIFTLSLLFFFKHCHVAKEKCSKRNSLGQSSLKPTHWTSHFERVSLDSIMISSLQSHALPQFSLSNNFIITSEPVLTTFYEQKYLRMMTQLLQGQHRLYMRHNKNNRINSAIIPDITILNAGHLETDIDGRDILLLIDVKSQDIDLFPADVRSHKLILRQVLLYVHYSGTRRVDISTPNQCYHLVGY